MFSRILMDYFMGGVQQLLRAAFTDSRDDCCCCCCCCCCFGKGVQRCEVRLWQLWMQFWQLHTFELFELQQVWAWSVRVLQHHPSDVTWWIHAGISVLKCQYMNDFEMQLVTDDVIKSCQWMWLTKWTSVETGEVILARETWFEVNEDKETVGMLLKQ